MKMVSYYSQNKIQMWYVVLTALLLAHPAPCPFPPPHLGQWFFLPRTLSPSFLPCTTPYWPWFLSVNANSLRRIYPYLLPYIRAPLIFHNTLFPSTALPMMQNYSLIQLKLLKCSDYLVTVYTHTLTHTHSPPATRLAAPWDFNSACYPPVCPLAFNTALHFHRAGA